jgi:hypothetical protein
MASSESSPKILTVEMLDAADDGIPVKITYRSSTVQKKIPPGHGVTRMSFIMDGDELVGAELVSQKI